MRFIARKAPASFAEIVEGLTGAPGANATETAVACANAVEAFIGQFDVPTRLTQFGVEKDQALRLAPAVLEELTLFDAMRGAVTLEEIRELLEELL